ncbi:hypothetical protein DsansV1_C07g0075321 [Dioscorea sansibarensis]
MTFYCIINLMAKHSFADPSVKSGFHRSRCGILNQYSASRSSFTTELTGLSTQKRWASRAATAAAARTSVDDNKISIGPKKEHCNNKALLARLTPEKPSGQESAFKNI